ncbi:MAG TPA: TetR/AcrR family transcriptional regulator [Rhizomicrobium sp.]|jgi:AcrR family transcriptional regulator
MDSEQISPPFTDRYTRKKEAIVGAATGILNRRGVKGMTLADVAASVDLITTSVTYYFKKKEDLAVACYLRSIARMEELIGGALGAPRAEDRLMTFLDRYLALERRIGEGEAPPLAIFSDIRALKEPYYATVLARYREMFRTIRRIFEGAGAGHLDRHTATLRTYMLLEQLYWAVTWLPRYDTDDYPRLRDRMFAILVDGIVRDDADWQQSASPCIPAALSGNGVGVHETYLIAATRLINQSGYRGASVEKISAQLNVTKGSFYHHNEGKEDLVVACFERSFETIRRAQRLAMERDGNFQHKLSVLTGALVEYQLCDRGPLLRTTALAALPEPLRQTMIARFNRVCDRFAAMISDGIAEGSLRAVDPFIAAQMLNATVNGAADLSLYVPSISQADVAQRYARPMLAGIFSAGGSINSQRRTSS